MDAATFLALVEKHPLPWSLIYGGSSPDEVGYRCLPEMETARAAGRDSSFVAGPLERGYLEASGLGHDESSSLADAAPAMASSILKCLKAQADLNEHLGSTFVVGVDDPDLAKKVTVKLQIARDMALFALRASLPQSLQEPLP